MRMHGSLEDACDPLKAVLRATMSHRGGEPGYRVFHVVKALELAYSRPVGRPLLQRALGIGESSVKTLIRRLIEEGLVYRGVKGGIVAAEESKAMIEVFRQTVKSVAARLWGGEWVIFLVKDVNPPVNLTEVYKIRDYLVEETCRISLIGGYTRGEPSFPGVSTSELGAINSVASTLA